MSSDSGETTVVRTIGRYRAFDELGRGAMGVVYRGFDPVIGRTVALKTLVIDTGDAQAREFRDRLYREAAAAGALSHPNIVTIYDIIEDGGVTAVAMEFIEGRSLASIIVERAPLPLDLAVEILDQICSALDYAGSQGIVHRDIKPANILITAGGRAKVTDFGVARLALSTMTQAGTVLGSPSYMSPEQVRGLSLDGRSDLFSAAVVFFEMITRERPFAGNDIATTMYRIAHEPPTPPGQFNAAIGPDVADVLDRAFAKDPAERFQAGADFVAELRRAAALASRKGMSPALASLAAAPPPPVPPIVAPAVTVSSAAGHSPADAAPGVVPVPIAEATPRSPAADGDSQGLAPIPGTGVPAQQPAVGQSAPGMALPTIPLPAVPARRPLAPSAPEGQAARRSGRKRRLALAGLGASVLAVAAIAGAVWFRGGNLQLPEVPAGPVPATAAAVQARPAPESTPEPVGSALPSTAVVGPATSALAPAAGGASRGIQAPAPPRPAGPAAQPRAGVRPAALPPAKGPDAVELPPAPSAPIEARSGRVYTSTEVDTRPEVLKQVPPEYPEDAARQRVQDVVVLKVLVGTTGRPEDVQVLRGSRKHSSLDGAAAAAVRQWVFNPARKGGQPVACWFNVGVPFPPPR